MWPLRKQENIEEDKPRHRLVLGWEFEVDDNTEKELVETNDLLGKMVGNDILDIRMEILRNSNSTPDDLKWLIEQRKPTEKHTQTLVRLIRELKENK